MLIKQNQGFTLVEMMITMLLAGIIMAAIYSAYITMQKSYVVQDQVAEMQQTLRAAMDYVVRDIRMAGYNPTKKATAGIIQQSNGGQLIASKDITNNAGTADDGDGDADDPNERVLYRILQADDANNDGIADAGAGVFARAPADAAGAPTGPFLDLAENIVAVEFNYILKNGTETRTPTAAQLSDIENIQISMLARSDRSDPDFAGGERFEPGSGKTVWGPFNDRFRHRLLITTVQCRNLGF